MRTSIDVAFSRGEPYQQLVSWPILEATAKAWLIQTPAGKLWVPSFRWNNMPLGPGATGDERKLNAVVGFLRSITSSSNDARVTVRRAGKGSSDLSVKVTFTVATRGTDGYSVIGERERTATVPASQLEQDGDQWSVPRWVLARKLKPSEGFQARPEWPGMQVLQDQLRAAFDAAAAGRVAAQISNRKAAQEAAQQRAERERIAADAKSLRQALVAEDGELALAFARRKLTLEDLAALGCKLSGWPRWLPGERVDDPLEITLAKLVNSVRGHPDFAAWRTRNFHQRGALLKPRKALQQRQPGRVIKNCVVEWCEYLGSSDNMRRVDHRDEGCTVAVFGRKHEIQLADGSIIVKMAGPFLKIIEPAPGEAAI